MDDSKAIFVFGTGAITSSRIPELLRRLVALDFTVYSVLTPNVAGVTDPAALMDVPDNRWIQSYRQEPLDRYPFGMLLVAPCTFNTFNKLAHGIADNLATGMIADGLGAGCPVLIAPSMNRGLWAHPMVAASHERLVGWGCEIIPPTVTAERVTMAPVDAVVEAVVRRREQG